MIGGPTGPGVVGRLPIQHRAHDGASDGDNDNKVYAHCANKSFLRPIRSVPVDTPRLLTQDDVSAA